MKYAKESAMRTDPPRFQLSLMPRTPFTLPDASGVLIECCSGSVWITLDHDPRDVVLAPGERFEANAHRPMVVSAFEPASIRVSGARPQGLPARETPQPSPWRLAARAMSPA
jgi:hypothetical protein